jgi:hypothetical protein
MAHFDLLVPDNAAIPINALIVQRGGRRAETAVIIHIAAVLERKNVWRQEQDCCFAKGTPLLYRCSGGKHSGV